MKDTKEEQKVFFLFFFEGSVIERPPMLSAHTRKGNYSKVLQDVTGVPKEANSIKN